MSPRAIDDGSPVGIIPSSDIPQKKHKRDKPEHKKKKRARDEDEPSVVEETPRKSKKSKSEKRDKADTTPDAQQNGEHTKHRKKHKERHEDDELPSPAIAHSQIESKKDKAHLQHVEAEQEDCVKEAESSSRKKSKKKERRVEGDEMDIDNADQSILDDSTSKRKRKEKKSKKHRAEEEPAEVDMEAPQGKGEKRKSKEKSKDKKRRLASPDASEDGDAMELDAVQTSGKPDADEDFPFFTQAVSLYVPFFPIGFDKPLTNVAAQHLDPLLNHYSPTLRGVLLSYSNLNLSDRPVKASLINPPTDETPALLQSVDEYAVGFGWLTFDAELFVPARGKWMEGVLQLQNEGHIGVVCWNKFNASIEAKRLPKGWKWVDISKRSDKTNGSSSLPSPDWDAEGNPEEQEEEDLLDGEELQVVEQMHTTGYWVNEKGRKVNGKLRFRIKNFDVGLAGDYGYLSIEGTFLDDDAERALAAEERQAEKRRRRIQNPNGLLRPMSRRVPEFSMTKLGREDQEEDSGQRTVVYRGSRPGTPDD